MEAERELDQQLAAVLGWHSFTLGLHGGMLLGLKAEEPAAAGVTSRHEEVPFFSTDMRAAWELVEWMQSQGWDWHLYRTWGGQAAAEFTRADTKERITEHGQDAPEAISRAALQTLSDS